MDTLRGRMSVFVCGCGGGTDDVFGENKDHARPLTRNRIATMESEADHKGYLMKQSVWLKTWRRRFFFLKDNVLYFSVKSGQRPHGRIVLTYNMVRVRSAEEQTDRRFSFAISIPGENYFLQARNEREKDQWVRAIGQAITMRQIHDEDATMDDGVDGEYT